MSYHNRSFVGKLASQGVLDVRMMRYNAAHRGAEDDFFSYLRKQNPEIVSNTATPSAGTTSGSCECTFEADQWAVNSNQGLP